MLYEVITQNNGVIDVTSEPNKGTTFDIYLPRCLETEVLAELAPPRAGVEIPQGGILVVEDDPSMLSLITRSLTNEDYTVLAANNPVEALLVAENNRDAIALVLTDIIMPGMNGVEMVLKIEA